MSKPAHILVIIFCVDVHFHNLEYIPRSGTTGSGGNSMFNFFRNCQTVFQSGCTVLHSYRQYQYSKVSISSHPHMVESYRHDTEGGEKQVADESVQHDPISTKVKNMQNKTTYSVGLHYVLLKYKKKKVTVRKKTKYGW